MFCFPIAALCFSCEAAVRLSSAGLFQGINWLCHSFMRDQPVDCGRELRVDRLHARFEELASYPASRLWHSFALLPLWVFLEEEAVERDTRVKGYRHPASTKKTPIFLILTAVVLFSTERLSRLRKGEGVCLWCLECLEVGNDWLIDKLVIPVIKRHYILGIHSRSCTCWPGVEFMTLWPRPERYRTSKTVFFFNVVPFRPQAACTRFFVSYTRAGTNWRFFNGSWRLILWSLSSVQRTQRRKRKRSRIPLKGPSTCGHKPVVYHSDQQATTSGFFPSGIHPSIVSNWRMMDSEWKSLHGS